MSAEAQKLAVECERGAVAIQAGLAEPAALASLLERLGFFLRKLSDITDEHGQEIPDHLLPHNVVRIVTDPRRRRRYE